MLRYKIADIDDFFERFDIEEQDRDAIRERVNSGDAVYVYQDGSVYYSGGRKPIEILGPDIDDEYSTGEYFREQSVPDGLTVEEVDETKAGWWKERQEAVIRGKSKGRSR